MKTKSKHRFGSLGAVILILLLMANSVLASAPADIGAAEPAGGSVFVQLPSDSAEQAEQLGLHPLVSVDYGSFQWLELSSADFARLAASGLEVAVAPDAGLVQAGAYRFDPRTDGEPQAAARAASAGPGFRLVQFVGPTQDAWLDALGAAGMRVLQYYPNHAYLVWSDAAAMRAAERLDFVRWTGNFYPAYKTSPELARRTGLVQNVDVMFYDDGNLKATLDALEAAGAKLIQTYPSQPDQAFFDAIVAMDAGAMETVAGLNTVLWLGYQSPRPVLDDEMSDQIVAGNYSAAGVPFTGYQAHLTSLGVNGAGVTWAVIDTGVDYDHPDLGSHIVGGYSFPGACNPAGQPGSDCPDGGHGTHVAGILGGDATAGFADPNGFKYGLGVAPEVGFYAMNSLSGSNWPPAGGWQEHSKRALLGAAIGGNNSWTTGEGANHGYQASERTHDLMVRDGNFDTASVAEPFIEVFSAGNSGPGANTLTAPKEAKNLIVVAASQNYRVGDINTVSSFSSRGPTADGRYGPTVTTPGEQISSARNDTGGTCTGSGYDIPGTNNRYSFCSGTSMASPHASGAVVLLTDWWRDGHGGANPSPAMAKALLVNGAVDMGAADIPNANEGWGRVNVTNIIHPLATTVYWDQLNVLHNTGEQWTVTMPVADPSRPLKISLAWTDAAGAVGANPALVNNLDLTVQMGANTYKGNVFSAGWSTTGGTANARENLENVYVRTPSGSATITVAATNLAGDGIPYNADTTDQDFALICQNCSPNPDYTLMVSPATANVCRSAAPTNYTVTVGQVMGYNQPVTLSVSGNPAGSTTNIAPNPVTPPGTATLGVQAGSAAAGNYTLNVSGSSASGSHSFPVGYNLYTAAPTGPALTAPANHATNVATTPTFTWNSVAQAASYSIQVATDPGFATIVATASGLNTTSYTPPAALNTGTLYYWRVWATNACGAGAYSAVFSFTTMTAPGDCASGTTANVILSEGFESGAAGWTHNAAVGTDSWRIWEDRVHTGDGAYHGDGFSTASDQRLVSPPVALPASQAPISLKFWNYQVLESRSSGGCYDGGLLEVSADNGGTWTQVPTANLLTDPYDGAISSNFGNPLAGMQAWCGDPQDWLNSVADVSAYAGQTVKFRFRLGTDTSVGREGWTIDDVVVQSCRAPYRLYLPMLSVR